MLYLLDWILSFTKLPYNLQLQLTYNLQLLFNGTLLAHISLYVLGHDYLCRQVEKVGTFLQEWIREASIFFSCSSLTAVASV